jgi:hypothetical protein
MRESFIASRRDAIVVTISLTSTEKTHNQEKKRANREKLGLGRAVRRK